MTPTPIGDATDYKVGYMQSTLECGDADEDDSKRADGPNAFEAFDRDRSSFDRTI